MSNKPRFLSLNAMMKRLSLFIILSGFILYAAFISPSLAQELPDIQLPDVAAENKEANASAEQPTSQAPEAEAASYENENADDGGFFSNLFGDDEEAQEETAAAEPEAAPEIALPAEEAKESEDEAAKKAAEKVAAAKKAAAAKPVPLPKRKPFKTYQSQNLPRTISKRHYSPQNSHLPPATYIEEHVHLLFNAIAQGNIPVVRALVEKYKGIDVRDREGNTPLLYATAIGNAQIVTMLVSMYADANVHNVYLETPLHKAAASGRSDLVAMLLKADAGLDEQNQSGMTPLMVAAERGFEKVVEQLIASNASTDIRRKDGNTALHLACVNPNPTPCYALLKVGAKTEYRNFEGLTPLMLAAKLGNVQGVSMLLRAGADTKTADASGRNAAHLASSHGYEQLAAAIDTETARRQKVADRLETLRTYGKYEPRDMRAPANSLGNTVRYASSGEPIKAKRRNGVPLPIAKPAGNPINSVASANAPLVGGEKEADYLPMYRSPIPRYLPTTPGYYGQTVGKTAGASPAESGIGIGGGYATHAPPAQAMVPQTVPASPANQVPDTIPTYNNVPPAPPAPAPSLDPAPTSPGGVDKMRVFRYF